MGEALLRFEEVSLRSGSGRMVFAGADWSLPRGARVRVAGAPGSGATALLRLAAGLAHPQRGRVVLDGVPHDPRTFDHPFLLRGGVAWVPQAGDLVANLTLLENVALPLRFVLGRGRDEAEAEALDLLTRLGLAEETGLRPHALARRHRQLGALARSAAGRPSLWLVDRLFDDLEAERLAVAVSLLETALADGEATLVLVGDGADSCRLAPTGVRLGEGRIIPEERT